MVVPTAKPRNLIPIDECGLLSRRNARRYCGCLSEARFDFEVAPHVRARLLGTRRYYSRKELDAWIDRKGAPEHPAIVELLARLDEGLERNRKRPSRARRDIDEPPAGGR